MACTGTLWLMQDKVARAVFALLAARMPLAELEDTKAATPKTLHNLWPRLRVRTT
jgi:hypothetical protein